MKKVLALVVLALVAVSFSAQAAPVVKPSPRVGGCTYDQVCVSGRCMQCTTCCYGINNDICSTQCT